MSATAIPTPAPTYSAAEHLLTQHRIDGTCPDCTAAFAAAETGQFCASRLCPVGLLLFDAAMKAAKARRAARMGVAS